MIQETGESVYVLPINLSLNQPQWFLLTADHHWDNPHCDRDLLANHFNRAKEIGAKAFVFGDLFCLMQGKKDPRNSKDDIRPEHKTSRYLDTVIEDAVNWYSKYSDIIELVSDGNHETKIQSHQETDVLSRFTSRMKAVTGNDITKGGYGGFIPIKFTVYSDTGKRSKTLTLNVYYFHGSGGGGAVTKGVIQTNRRQVFVDADILVTGHVHNAFEMPLQKLKLNQNYTGYNHLTQDHIQVPTYKQEFDLKGNFHVESGREPKPLGCYWLCITPEYIDGQIQLTRTIQKTQQKLKLSGKKS
jgi:hypothetical protein